MNTPEREELPELPPHHYEVSSGAGLYTADQLRAYGRLCREDGRRAPQPDASAEGREDIDGYADSLEQIAHSTFQLYDQPMPANCKECLLEAAALLRRLAPKAGDVVDRGPWKAFISVNGKVVVSSDDFTHDVWLYVSGDFASSDQALEYASHIASRLNAPSAPVAGSDEILRMCDLADKQGIGTLSTNYVRAALEAKP